MNLTICLRFKRLFFMDSILQASISYIMMGLISMHYAIMLYDTQIFYTILEWLAGSAVIIDFMINTINTLYSYGIC